MVEAQWKWAWKEGGRESRRKPGDRIYRKRFGQIGRKSSN
jgi:hypothetical protein